MKTFAIVMICIVVLLLLIARRINRKENWSRPHCFGDKQIHASGWHTDPCRQCEHFSECIRDTMKRRGDE